jgi:hypothetical protein
MWSCSRFDGVACIQYRGADFCAIFEKSNRAEICAPAGKYKVKTYMSHSSVPTQKIKILFVIDSALIRSILKEMINSCQDIGAIGAASNPLQVQCW